MTNMFDDHDDLRSSDNNEEHPKSRKLDSDKLRRVVLAKGFKNLLQWKNSKLRPSRGTKGRMIDEGMASPASVELAASQLGLSKNGLWRDRQCPLQPLNRAADNARKEFIRQVKSGLILPETLGSTGQLIPTSVIETLRQITRHSATMYNYKVSDDNCFLQLVIDRLLRDTFIVESKDTPGAYELHVPLVSECQKDIDIRVLVEMIFATPRIIDAQNNLVARQSLLDAFDEVLADSNEVRHRGGGMRAFDHSFHSVWPETPGGCEVILAAVQSTDRLYLRWRFLLKVVHNDASDEYIAAITAFNDQRIEELVSIRNAIEAGEGPEVIETILKQHAQPAIWLLAECDNLVRRIKQRDGEASN